MYSDSIAIVKRFLCTNALMGMIFFSHSVSAFGVFPPLSSSSLSPSLLSTSIPMTIPMLTKTISTSSFNRLRSSKKGSKHSMARKGSCNKDFTLYYKNDDDGGQNDDTAIDTAINTPTAESNIDSPKSKDQLQSSMKDTTLEENQTNLSGKSGLLEGVQRWYNSAINRNDTIDQQKQPSNGKLSPLPIMIQDLSLLYYDIFLLLNLSVSISFWVVHRMSLTCVMDAFSEGCLLCILWIVSGLYNGSFLYSASDGHYDMTREENLDKGGPKAAGQLGLWTFVGTVNLRMVVALSLAVLEHRPVGAANGEELIPLELCFGLVLMSMWRMLHSAYTRV